MVSCNHNTPYHESFKSKMDIQYIYLVFLIGMSSHKDFYSQTMLSFPTAVLNLDNAVVDLETLQALYENVSPKIVSVF